MKSILRLGLLVCAAAGFSAASFAQSAPQNNQVFKLSPIAPWHYGVTQQGNAEVFGGCVFSNLFDNGFILRFTENDGEVQRITFNFRQEVFKPGSVYPSKIEVAEKVVLVPGVATSFNMLEYKTTGELSTQELYLNKDKPLSLTIEGKEFIFSLPGLKESLSSLKDCRPVPLAKEPMSDLAPPQEAPQPKPEPEDMALSTPEPQLPAYEKSYETERLEQLAAKVDSLKADIAALSFQGQGVADAPQAQQEVQPAEGLLPVPGIGAQARAQAQQAKSTPQNIIDEPIRYSLNEQMPEDRMAGKKAENDPWGIKKAAGQTGAPEEVAAVEPKTFNVEGAPRVSTPKLKYRKREIVGADKYGIEPDMVEVKKDTQAKWQAKAGEPLRVVLARWAREAGVNLVWDTDNDFVLPIDINSNSDFQETVAQALALYDEQNVRPFGAMDFKPVRSDAQMVGKVEAKPAPEVYQDTREWLALEGMDLRAVVEGWAASEGIKVIWMAPQRFNLQETVKVRNGFANAIESALGQFKNNDVRPVAQLNTDPNNGEQVLLVRLASQTS